MSRTPAVLLLLGLALTAARAEAIDPNVANHALQVKDAPSGDQMGDTREGGESWNDAIVIRYLPFSDTGATCDNVDDITLPCAASNAPSPSRLSDRRHVGGRAGLS